MIRKFGGTTGIDNQPQGLDLGLSGSNIKSIQTGVATLSLASNNITINPVDLTKSVVIISTDSIGNTAPANFLTEAQLTTSTNLNLAIYTYNTAVNVYWTVIEFNNVKSFQKLEVALLSSDSSAKSVVISSVNINKALIFCSLRSDGANDTRTVMPIYSFTDSTHIRLAQSNLSNTKTIILQVIEFY